MMKRLLLALGFSLLAGHAWAACGVTNLQVKDNAGTTANVPYADDGAGASNCSPQVQIKQGGNVATVDGSGRLQLNLAAMGGTAINSACVAALNGFSSTIPATVCGVFGTYVLNANPNVGNNADAVAAGATAGSPVVGYNYGFNGSTWDRLRVDAAKNLMVSSIGQPNVGLTDCSGTITSGGAAQSLISAQTTLHGFTLANIDASAGSGEDLWFSFTGTAAASTAGSYPLIPPASTTQQGGSWTSPVGMGTSHAVSIIGATTGHKFSCTWW